jgi:ferritin-like metal-binding protein YciE
MGRADVVKLLEATEKEEINADKTLSQVAVGEANRKAA